MNCCCSMQRFPPLGSPWSGIPSRTEGERASEAGMSTSVQVQEPKPRSLRLDSADESEFPYPGIPTTCDGAEAVVHVEARISQAAGAYPITSSTTMGGGFNEAANNGGVNLWGDPLVFFEPESEHSAASSCEGFALAGGRVTNFTSGQGLVLMKEVLYTISGKRLPVVFHIGARALTLISRRAAEDCETPFMNVQDGFLTTHTVENLLKCEPAMMKEFVGHPS